MVTAFRVLLIICFTLSFAGGVAEKEENKKWHLLNCAVQGSLFIATYVAGM